MKTMRAAVLIGMSMLLGACSPSWYHLDLSNHSAENIRVDVKAQKGDAEPTLIASGPMSAGQTYKMSAPADRDAKVQVEARVQGDDKTPPATKKVFVGTSNLIINPNPDSTND